MSINKEDKVMSDAYLLLLIASSYLVSLAHGANDVANTISELMVVAEVHDLNLNVPFYLGGSGMALGILTIGYIVMRTVGKKLVKLDYVRGFSA